MPVNPNPVIGGHEPCGIVAAIGPEVGEKMARRDLGGFRPDGSPSAEKLGSKDERPLLLELGQMADKLKLVSEKMCFS